MKNYFVINRFLKDKFIMQKFFTKGLGIKINSKEDLDRHRVICKKVIKENLEDLLKDYQGILYVDTNDYVAKLLTNMNGVEVEKVRNRFKRSCFLEKALFLGVKNNFDSFSKPYVKKFLFHKTGFARYRLTVNKTNLTKSNSFSK